MENHKQRKEKEAQENEDSVKIYQSQNPSVIELQDQALDDVKSQPEEKNEEEDNASDKMSTVFSFTKRKWSNIDELIQVLQEEIQEETNANEGN